MLHDCQGDDKIGNQWLTIDQNDYYCPSISGDGCDLSDNYRLKCTSPQYYADPSFDPHTWDPCTSKNEGTLPPLYKPTGV